MYVLIAEQNIHQCQDTVSTTRRNQQVTAGKPCSKVGTERNESDSDVQSNAVKERGATIDFGGTVHLISDAERLVHNLENKFGNGVTNG